MPDPSNDLQVAEEAQVSGGKRYKINMAKSSYGNAASSLYIGLIKLGPSVAAQPPCL